MVLCDASNNSMDVLRQRYAGSKHSSATTTTTTTPSTSGHLTEFNLGNHELACNNTTPTAGMTSFLPTLHSTPPMPTFQKPGMHFEESPSPTSNITYRARTTRNHRHDTSLPHSVSRTTMSTSSPNNLASRPATSQPPVFQRRRETNNTSSDENAPLPRIYIPHRSPETIDGYWASPKTSGVSGEEATRASFTKNRITQRAYSTTPLIDRVPDMAPLPGRWNEKVDRLICKADALGYDHARIVRKVRQFHPNVRGVLTPPMIDKRLRQLDQDIEIDYWQAGLATPSPPTSPARTSEDSGSGMRRYSNGEWPLITTSEQHIALQQLQQQQQGEQRHLDWVSQYGSPIARGRNQPSSPSVRRNDSASLSRQ